jgi:hypothetical protein
MVQGSISTEEVDLRHSRRSQFGQLQSISVAAQTARKQSFWIAPASHPPVCEAASAEYDPTPDPALTPTPTPAYELDQRIAW